MSNTLIFIILLIALYSPNNFLNAFQFSSRIEKSFLTAKYLQNKLPMTSTSISFSIPVLSTTSLSSNQRNFHLMGGSISDFDFDAGGGETEEVKSDLELGKTHGYEGDFKTGDKVRIKSDTRLWHVKEYAKEGFLCKGYEGVVVGFDLYGRKMKSLCSAITPVKVEFAPDGNGVPPGAYLYHLYLWMYECSLRLLYCLCSDIFQFFIFWLLDPSYIH